MPARSLARSLGPVSGSHLLFRPPLVILTGIINAAASHTSASFPPTQKSVSLQMRRRAWRKSRHLISPPPTFHPPPPAPNPPNSPSTPTSAVCMRRWWPGTIYRMDQQQYRLVSIHEPSGCSLCLSITTFQQEKGAHGSKPAIFTWPKAKSVFFFLSLPAEHIPAR